MDESWNKYTEWKKPDKKEYILYDYFTDTEFQEMLTNLYLQKKAGQWLPRDKGPGNQRRR